MASLISTGPFVSGTSHRLLTQGQLVDAVAGTAAAAAAVVTQATGQKRKLRMSLTEQQRHPSEEPSDLSPSPAGPTSSTKSKGGGSSPTLGDMLAAGLLQAGQDNVTVIYRGVTYSASLQANGTIAFRGSEFTTPSAFSVYVKRLVSPNKQGDDGWHSVSVAGVPLHRLRLRYQQQHGGQLPPTRDQHTSSSRKQRSNSCAGSPAAAAGAAGPSAAAAAGAKGGGGSSTPQGAAAAPAGQQASLRWVQCGRCEVWRSVPQGCWTQLDADAKREFFCEEAWWDVAAMEPFTPACISDVHAAEADEAA
ncbi:hypothetical protein COO60DRAFT_1698027 [Scenedesmus sp. NREL 46B-D3]|nr:hypothetical protein COO60DRAFT_1698027 [Scenedesmus sp. NREL 46B-D3]